jgi:integrase
MFRFASDREIVARNPLDGIRRASIGGKDVERDRILSDETRPPVGRGRQRNLSRRSELAVWLILLRRAGLAKRWRHGGNTSTWIKRTWYLPETKNQRDHVIHLSDFALQQIEALSSLRELDRGGSSVPWLFPTKSGTGHLCVKSFGKQLADRQRTEADRLQNRTKQTDSLALQGGRWVAHDLRRTAATMMARSGVPTDVIDECLNHKLRSKVSRVYIKGSAAAGASRCFRQAREHDQPTWSRRREQSEASSFRFVQAA